MKKYIVNLWVNKDGNSSRSNFNIYTDKTSQTELNSLIMEKCKVDDSKWTLDTEKYELIEKESVIRYVVNFKKVETVSE